MSKLRLVVSLPNQNHYQKEQAKAAQMRAEVLGAEVKILDANNDSVSQSQQSSRSASIEIRTPARRDPGGTTDFDWTHQSR